MRRSRHRSGVKGLTRARKATATLPWPVSTAQLLPASLSVQQIPPPSIACSVLCTMYPGLSLPLRPEAPGLQVSLGELWERAEGPGACSWRSEEGEEEALHRTNSVPCMTATPAHIYLLRRHASKKTTAMDAEGRLNSRSNGATCSYLRNRVTGSKGTGA